ncbi:MAG: hypothetical protein C4329_08665 [Chitinophagaceae bacterium]
MVEKQNINGKDVWIKVDSQPTNRSNPNIIPTEYFTASYFPAEPSLDAVEGEIIKDSDGQPHLFETPVAALAYARKTSENIKLKFL